MTTGMGSVDLAEPPEWIDLAADIRAIDGNHDTGAGALAAALTARGWTRSRGPRLSVALAAITALEHNPLATCKDCTAPSTAEGEPPCIDGGMVRDTLRDLFDPATTEPKEPGEELPPSSPDPLTAEDPIYGRVQSKAGRALLDAIFYERRPNAMREAVREALPTIEVLPSAPDHRLRDAIADIIANADSERSPDSIAGDVLAVLSEATPSSEPALDVEALARVREWVRSRAATEWSPGFGSDFRRGYDAAWTEVAAQIGENVEG